MIKSCCTPAWLISRWLYPLLIMWSSEKATEGHEVNHQSFCSKTSSIWPHLLLWAKCVGFAVPIKLPSRLLFLSPNVCLVMHGSIWRTYFSHFFRDVHAISFQWHLPPQRPLAHLSHCFAFAHVAQWIWNKLLPVLRSLHDLNKFTSYRKNSLLNQSVTFLFPSPFLKLWNARNKMK